MQTMQSKHPRKKEPFPEKIKPASLKPSAHRRVVFFAGAGWSQTLSAARPCNLVSANADKGGFEVWHIFILQTNKSNEQTLSTW